MAPTAVSSRKRKTTDEMVESPPKRQTRARAAKATEDNTATKVQAPKTTRITTASARIAAEARAAARSAPKTTSTTTKRKTRTTTSSQESLGTSKPRTSVRKPIESNKAPEIKTRARATKSTPTEAKLEDKSKTRVKRTKTESNVEVQEPVVKRTTRARSATINSETDAEVKQPEVKKVVKRVTFQEDLIQDKENKPISNATKKEPAKTTGIKARPVRQTTSRTTARSRKGLDTVPEKKSPLSPRKVTQIAKSTSSSEDELIKAPLKKILKSSMKQPVTEAASPELASKSPIRPKPADMEKEVLLASPAKRPPQSPFKEALNQSPKKFPMPTPMPDFSNAGAAEASQESLKQSPRKFDFTPKKSTTEVRSNAGAMARAALLGSPARRPTSPMKLGSVRLPDKVGVPKSVTNTTSILRHVKDNSLFAATPRRLFGSPSKNVSKQVSPVKHPEVVPDETVELTQIQEDPTISEVHVQTPFGFQKYSNPVQFCEPKEVFEHDTFEESGHYRSIDENSEDELSLGPLTTSPRKSTLLVRRLASSPGTAPTPRSAMDSLITPRPRAKDQLMTPLAVQFSTWLATSPTRSESEEGTSTEIYTPVAEVLHNRHGSRRVTMTPGSRPTYFEDQLLQVNLIATPQDSMQDQDLHTDEDLEMVDNIAFDASEAIIAATPEELLNESLLAQDHDLDMLDENEIVVTSNSFEAGSEVQIADENALDADLSLADIKSLVETPASAAKLVLSEAATTENLDDASEIHENEEQDQDATVIINRPLRADDVLDEVMEGSSEIMRDDSGSTNMIAEADEESSPEDEQYGDENVVPADNAEVTNSLSICKLNQEFSTPIQAIRTRSKEVRTVARVPLKPSSDASPMQIKGRKGRSKSMSTPLAELEIANDLLVPKVMASKDEKPSVEKSQTPVHTPRSVSQPLSALAAPEDDLISLASSPFKSVRKGPDARILRGAIVHVDVHTSEGADASGIFIELLTQMGARCIKQWNWNSRSTLGGGDDPAASIKVGITHVVFKDGSKRTLQKVREAKGLVLCVGVGWVLDCERANRWLDEAPFAVDTSTIPRGGHNRRKSMEPKMLANLQGNLVTVTTPAKNSRKSLRLSKARESLATVPAATETDIDETVLAPFTPGQETVYDASQSPTTPFLESEGSKLIQQTCPPKKSRQNLFPVSGNLGDQPDESIRERLAKARRKTMEFAPRYASPLGRAVPKKV